MRRHERRIFYLHRRFTGNAAVAEELCQETFLRAWQKLATFEGRGAFGGWLTRLAYNVFLQYRRRQGVHDEAEPLDGAGDDRGGRTPLSALGSAGDERDLERLLAVVTAEEQRLLVLSYAGGLSASEIGDMLGTSPGTVKSRIHRAKEKIRRHFHIEVKA